MTGYATRRHTRKLTVERHEIIKLLGQLKLAGMRAAYDEVVAAGVRAQHPVQRIFGELLRAQLADNRARSIAYRMGVARFPVMKNLAEFDFTVSPVNQGLVRELHEGGFLATQRNAVLIGGTGTGKSHIAIAIGANCVRYGARVRFFTAVDLVNQLEAEARAGKAGRLSDQLDPPPVWWTPMLGFRARRTVSDECDAPDISRRVQARGG